MRSATGIILVLALVLKASLQYGDQKSGSEKSAAEREREDRILKLYVGYYSQTTLINVVTRTQTAVSTCISTTTTMAACTGRRRRSLIEDTDLESEDGLEEFDPTALDASQDPKMPYQPKELHDRHGKKVTLWTSVFSTLEITTTVYNAGTTLTVSAVCNIVNGMTIGNSCFG